MSGEPTEAKHLDDKGRCCGRKPIVYKSTQLLFCSRCGADYNMAGEQVPNWEYPRLTDIMSASVRSSASRYVK